MGLFKFALPTFAKDELSIWEREGSRWKTVPLPPNRNRKGLRRDRKESLKKSVHRAKKKDGVFIAYVVMVPSNDSSLQERAAVLAASIEKVHGNSPYQYQLYAIDYQTQSNPVTDTLARLGYKLMYVSHSDLDSKAEKTMQSSIHHNLKELIQNNNIVVHLNLDSFVLKSMDSIYDKLLKGNYTDFIVSNGTSNGWLRKKSAKNVDMVSSENVSQDDGNTQQFHIFKSSSIEAAKSYLNFLKCITSMSRTIKDKSSVVTNTDIQRREDTWQPTLYPKIRHLLASAAPRTKPNENVDATKRKHCEIHSQNAMLDKCIYSTGSYECTSSMQNALVASFNSNICTKPWECELDENRNGCINHGGIGDEDCDALQREWLRVSKSL